MLSTKNKKIRSDNNTAIMPNMTGYIMLKILLLIFMDENIIKLYINKVINITIAKK
jgi:hypothetical protein